MKKIRFLSVLLVIILSLSLFGCEFLDSFVQDNDGGGSNLIGGEGGSSGGSGSGSEETGGSSDSDHVCEFVCVSVIDSTCSVAGKKIYECSCGKSNEVTSPLLSHTAVVIPAVEAMGSTPARTEGSACSSCGQVLVAPEVVFSSDFTTPKKYDGSYAYNYISSLKNGEKLTELYNLIDLNADLFHFSGENANDNLVIAEINFGELGLTSEEALATWSAYVADHPLYYWMSKNVSYTANSLSVKVDAEYKNGSVRNEYNAKIYAKAEQFITRITSDSEYIISLMLHDFIISSGDYAYEADGETPKDDNYAHNILGILEMGEGVCESYAKSFQLMLNYCGVECVFVSGYAGEPHAWNLVKLDDGKWYCFDLTWDDTPDFMWGISYRYFSVGSDNELMDVDGPWYDTDPKTFAQSHIPNAKCDTGVDFMYELPVISGDNFTDSALLLRKTFKVGDFTYAISGYNTVQLVRIEKSGDVVIPESVSYNGVTFKIASIGIIDDDGLFDTGSIVADYYDMYGNLSMPITSISIPSGVDIIWDDALNIQTLKSISVSADNKSYASVDGVLFTKDLKTLVKYPSAREGTSYTLPEQTVRIAAYAFNMYFSNVELVNLETIVLGENTTSAGAAHFGYGYEDTSFGNFIYHEWIKIEEYLKGNGKILTKSGEEFSDAA